MLASYVPNILRDAENLIDPTDREFISRVEIIDENGRAYTRDELFIDLISVQDEGRTLKVRPHRDHPSRPFPGQMSVILPTGPHDRPSW